MEASDARRSPEQVDRLPDRARRVPRGGANLHYLHPTPAHRDDVGEGTAGVDPDQERRRAQVAGFVLVAGAGVASALLSALVSAGVSALPSAASFLPPFPEPDRP